MAQPITFYVPPNHRVSSESRLQRAPAQHAEALLSAYDLLQSLHDSGAVDLLRGLLEARDELACIVASTVDTPEAIRGIRNFLLLSKLFASMPPDVLQSLTEAVVEGAKREKSHKAPGLGSLLWRFRDPDSRHALAVILDLLKAVGRGLR